MSTLGIHHVSALTRSPRDTLDFYGGLLGLRLVALTVNFDEPSGYHLYYGDDAARPGSLLTLFPLPASPAGRGGAGDAVETALAVPAGAHAIWMDRFADAAWETWEAPETRFDEPILRLRDPDGNHLALIEDPAVTGGWEAGSVPVEAAAGGLHSVTLAPRKAEDTLRLLIEVMGFEERRADGSRTRVINPRADRAGIVDVVQVDDLHRPGAGTIHHVAFRVADEEGLDAVRGALLERDLSPTAVVDRHYFRSVYFREPGGILFELATDGPGFGAATEDRSLALPPWLEGRRSEIEAALPPLGAE